VTRERSMALLFALGSTCFVIVPLRTYLDLVGPGASAATLFAGSILFTAGGALQTVLAAPERRSGTSGRAAWWTAITQSLGTLFFNLSTFRAVEGALSSPSYDALVWRPDAFGSACFLVSGAIAYGASSRQGWRPRRDHRLWWEPGVNLLGCVLFGVAAVAGYVVPATGSAVDLGAANWSTAAGGACFLACALGVLLTGRTFRSPRTRLQRG
jgi:hypothetical protein